jgi:DNA-binding MarR family transcriptional regulator
MKNIVNMGICQRRQRCTDHFLPLDKTILFAYPNLSDGAKLTYMTLDSYDWTDEDGTSKGYVYPSQATLAKVRGITERTLRRHLDELEQVGLITTEAVTTAHGKHNVYVIHDASDEEVERYLSLVDKPTVSDAPDPMHDSQPEGEKAQPVEIDLTPPVKDVSMGADKNDRYKDNKHLSIQDQKQDQTVLSCRVSFSSNQKLRLGTPEGVPAIDSAIPCEPLSDRLNQVFADIMGRIPSSTEETHLANLVHLYSANEVELAMSELMVALDLRPVQSPTRYVAGVLRNWGREGRRVTDILQHLRRVGEIHAA